MLKETDLVVVQRLLGVRLLKYLDSLDPVLREDVRVALASEGKVLHQPASELDGRWALLPFYLMQDLQETTGSVQIEESAACDVALSMECVVCATDLLDDVMDDDKTPLLEQLGIARVLNVALALIALSQRMLLALLDQNLPVRLPTRLMDMMQRAILQASAGQQQDLLAERRLAGDLTREECLAIARAKAGALLGLACQMGAVCAGLEEARVQECAEVGRLLGIAAQLDNDAHDLYTLLYEDADARYHQKSDLVRGKKTLPIVLAAHALQTTLGQKVEQIDFRRLALLPAEQRARYLSALREGIISTWGIALLYRARAKECLEKIVGEGGISGALYRVAGVGEELAEVKTAGE